MFAVLATIWRPSFVSPAASSSSVTVTSSVEIAPSESI